MVILKATPTVLAGLENTVVINSAVEELRPYSEIIITKSNGTRHQFRLILNSSVPMKYVLIGDTESQMYRFHSGHKYHIEGVKSSVMIKKKPIVDFSQMKIAGYSSLIEQIMQRVFRPRKLSLEFRNKFNIRFIRGVVLYGPPGTGKTTLVKTMCEYFNLKPRIVNGAQLLDPFIGRSEEAVRALFEKAVKDQKENGDSSPLHVFVFEEMDALFLKRKSGDGGSETRNSIVGQLLPILDGYNQLNNILIFGIINRLDMIDPALLRAGRFEMQLKVDFPNAQERMEILNFHLSAQQKNGVLAADVSMANLKQLVDATENFTRADLSQIVQLANAEATGEVFTDATLDLQPLRLEDETNTFLRWSHLVNAYHVCQQYRQTRENNSTKKQADSEDNIRSS